MYYKADYITVKQPVGTFYVVSMPSDVANEITFAQERLRSQNDIAEYLGIQRTLRPERVRDISKYVEGIDSTFPSSIILAIDEYTEGDEEPNVVISGGQISIKRAPKVAEILDGQHRLHGLRQAGNPDFELVISLFVNLEIEDRARIFATINLEQSKVNRSHAYDLLAYARSRSPNKSAHDVALVLNREKKSPFYGKIKRLGVAEGSTETLAQATFVNALSPLITRVDIEDRNALKEKKALPQPTSVERTQRPLRKMWIDEEDGNIAVLMGRYFNAAKSLWHSSWEQSYPHERSVLPRTAGYLGMMKALPKMLEILHFDGVLVPEASAFANSLQKSNLTDDDFDSVSVEPGTRGQNAIRDAIWAGIGFVPIVRK